MSFYEEYCTACKWFTGQRDENHDIAITFCTHPDNPSDYEGNTNGSDCPIIQVMQIGESYD